MKGKIIIAVFVCLILLILAGCTAVSGPSVDSDYKIGIRGTITDINAGKDGANILVEGNIEPDTEYDKASVRIDTRTMIQKDDLSRLFEYTDLKLGDKVEVVFRGAVAESYPVQGTAEIVRIITEA